MALAAAGCSGGKPSNSADPDNPLGLEQDPQRALETCVPPEDRAKRPEDIPTADRQEMIGCINAEMAEQLRPQLPVDVDQVTKLVDITSEGPMLTYHYRIAMKAADFGPEAIAQIDQQVRRTACGHPQMRQTIGLGGAYGYRWADSDGAPIHALRIDSCDQVSRLPRRPL
jgi:hypothetical protein